ncbi:putative clathrin assembly protein [Nymphaea thermarum]|nr:putative clathrin assembly protein [Nymphaea thermarum]
MEENHVQYLPRLHLRKAWGYSAWIRVYALFLEEKLEYFCVLKYDIEIDEPKSQLIEKIEVRLLVKKVQISSTKKPNFASANVNEIEEFDELFKKNFRENALH